MKEAKGGIPEKNEDVWNFYEGWWHVSFNVEGVPHPATALSLSPSSWTKLSSTATTGTHMVV
jgi:hypothetical protein